jgi:hypothetical protein
VSAAIIFALVASTAAALFARPGGDNGDEPDDTVNELFELVARGAGATYHARYDVRFSDEDFIAAVWQQPPLRRHDLTLAAGGEAEHLSTIFDGERSARCTKAGDADWTCDDDPSGQQSELEGLFALVTNALFGAEVGARDDTVAGVDVRCFTGVEQDRTEEVCTTHDGVIVRATTSEATLVLQELSREVPAQVFVIPA